MKTRRDVLKIVGMAAVDPAFFALRDVIDTRRMKA
jgi:hypothetical protein